MILACGICDLGFFFFVTELWRQVIVNPSIDDHVKKPDRLSFCIGSKMPISTSLRQELLETDGISNRLQREIQLLKAFNIIRCRTCLVMIYLTHLVTLLNSLML